MVSPTEEGSDKTGGVFLFWVGFGFLFVLGFFSGKQNHKKDWIPVKFWITFLEAQSKYTIHLERNGIWLFLFV